MTLSRLLKLTVLTAIGFIAFYGFVFYSASHGDAFRSFAAWSKRSPVFQKKFGEVKGVHLKLLGGYSEKTRGDKGSARFVANVAGTQSSGDVNVIMDQKDGVWVVQRVEGEGNFIVTNEQ